MGKHENAANNPRKLGEVLCRVILESTLRHTYVETFSSVTFFMYAWRRSATGMSATREDESISEDTLALVPTIPEPPLAEQARELAAKVREARAGLAEVMTSEFDARENS